MLHVRARASLADGCQIMAALRQQATAGNYLRLRKVRVMTRQPECLASLAPLGNTHCMQMASEKL